MGRKTPETMPLFEEMSEASTESWGKCIAGHFCLYEDRRGHKRGRVTREVIRFIGYCRFQLVANRAMAIATFEQIRTRRKAAAAALAEMHVARLEETLGPAPQRPSVIRIVKKSRCLKGGCMHFRKAIVDRELREG